MKLIGPERIGALGWNFRSACQLSSLFSIASQTDVAHQMSGTIASPQCVIPAQRQVRAFDHPAHELRLTDGWEWPVVASWRDTIACTDKEALS